MFVGDRFCQSRCCSFAFSSRVSVPAKGKGSWERRVSVLGLQIQICDGERERDTSSLSDGVRFIPLNIHRAQSVSEEKEAIPTPTHGQRGQLEVMISSLR